MKLCPVQSSVPNEQPLVPAREKVETSSPGTSTRWGEDRAESQPHPHAFPVKLQLLPSSALSSESRGVSDFLAHALLLGHQRLTPSVAEGRPSMTVG